MYDISNHNDQLKNLLNIEIGKLSPKEKIYFCFSKANIYHFKKDYKKSAYFLQIANDEKLKIQPSDLKRKLNTGEYYRNFKVENTSKIIIYMIVNQKNVSIETLKKIMASYYLTDE